jgi:AraC-like DNA-binding protein
MKSNGVSLADSRSTLAENVIEFILSRELSELRELTVGSVARTFNLHRCYLSRRFKSEKQYSLHDYIVMAKILRSLSLMESDEEITIDVLAQKIGFSSSDYFTRLFKRFIGTTPGRYKKCIKKQKNPAKQ